MDKMLSMGTRMQKAIASGDYDTIYDDTGAERTASQQMTTAAAPSGSMPPEAGAAAVYRFGGTDPLSQEVAMGLNRWAGGTMSAPDAPGARGPGMIPGRRR